MPYTFQEEPPKEWKMYPPEFIKGCVPKLMWTNEQPEEPLKLEDGVTCWEGLYTVHTTSGKKQTDGL